MAFASEIDSRLHPSLFHVVSLGQVLPLTTLAARVAAVTRPDERAGILCSSNEA